MRFATSRLTTHKHVPPARKDDALADRDAADDALDDLERRHRRAREGRGTSASRERPYVDIYPCSVDEEVWDSTMQRLLSPTHGGGR